MGGGGGRREWEEEVEGEWEERMGGRVGGGTRSHTGMTRMYNTGSILPGYYVIQENITTP